MASENEYARYHNRIGKGGIKMKYVEDENPIEEIYRIREAILKEHGGVKEYHKYLRDTQHKVEEAGFHFVNLKEEENRKRNT
jgi:hypothetical protein